MWSLACMGEALTFIDGNVSIFIQARFHAPWNALRKSLTPSLYTNFNLNMLQLNKTSSKQLTSPG